MNGELTYIQKVAMSKRKVVNNIHISKDLLLDCLENNIIMGEAQWLTNEESQLLERKYNMSTPSDGPDYLVAFQNRLDIAVMECFGKRSYPTGIRFTESGILVTIAVDSEKEVFDTILLPLDIPHVTLVTVLVDVINGILFERATQERKRADRQKQVEEENERDIYERLRKKFEKVD